jgi:hypothetical protein
MIKSRWHPRRAEAFLIILFVSLGVSAQRPPEPATAKAESKSGVISGRVVNENGQPHVNVSVVVRPNTPEGVPVTQTTTNRNGFFNVSGLENGSYTVSAAVPAYLPKPSNTELIYRDGELVTLVLVKGAVITGTVTNLKGEPIVGIGVRVRMARDESGRSYENYGRYYDNMTDDRGVYRVYGLPTAIYVVSADGSVEDRSSLPFGLNGFANNLPTYAPSSNRDDAAEISVRSGEEVGDVNIRYRGERGSRISGIVSGLPDNHSGYSLQLSSVVGGRLQRNNQFQNANGEFAFDGIPDGEYQLAAAAYWSDRSYRKSESIFVNVRGADIEGLVLAPAPLASIEGHVVLEALKAPPPECTDKSQPQFPETSVMAWQRVTEGARKKPQFVWRAGGPERPNAEGKVTFKGLAASEYYFTVRFSSKQWFLRSIAFASPNSKPMDATRTWTIVKPGDQLSGLTFTLAQGAGSVRGEITLADGQTLPEKLVAYLVPAEREQADEVLRYYAAPVSSAGSFLLSNVAPGSYWIIFQPGSDDTRNEVSKLRLPDGAQTRSSLRHAAGAAKPIEVKPCQDVTFRLDL